MVWSQLAASSVNVAYAIVGLFAILFSLVSSPIKEKLYIGEASVATIAGVIFGPFCLKWFIPTQWGSETIPLQISRVVLCIQIFASAAELPKKYMKKHWLSVFILIVPTMTAGWLIMGLFTWIIFKPLNFSSSLLIAACVTATDPVLAAAVVGKGKFAQKVPGHLRNLLTAESGCNDGMAFPFIFLAMNLILHAGHAREIVKDWFCITILYECIFGAVLGTIIGWIARRAITLAEKFGTIDRESFLAFYVMLSFACAGLGSILGVDELLVSFCAGLAFSWNGQYAHKTDNAHVSTTIDLLLNLSYFVYLGALLPWNFYHQPHLGLPFWKYFLLALVTIFLRRIPAVMATWRITPDLSTWREALFAGHFGPIGVGAIYAVILARSEVEEASLGHISKLTDLPAEGIENYHLILYLWPVVTFVVVSSIVVHGSSVAVIVFGKRLRTMSISMTFTQTQANPNSTNWMSGLPRIETAGRSFSLRRVVSKLPSGDDATIETSGIPVRPAGGLRRRRKFRKRRDGENRQRPKVEKLDLNKNNRRRDEELQIDLTEVEKSSLNEHKHDIDESTPSSTDYHDEKTQDTETPDVPTTGYQEGSELILEDDGGEVVSVLDVDPDSVSEVESSDLRSRTSVRSTGSIDTSHHRRKSNPLEKIRSNISSKFRQPSSSQGEKYTAYRVRDEIIIENNEGEVLKRYKIHNHEVTNTQPSASPTLRQRAMSLVGFKPQQPKSKEEYLEEGGSSAPILVPETEGVITHDNALLKASDNKIQKKLLGLINDDGLLKPKKIPSASLEDVPELPHPKRHRSPPPRPNVYDFAKDDEDEDDEDDDDEDQSNISDSEDVDVGDDEYEETEAERVRRMDALGLGNRVRDEFDEEEEIRVPGSSRRGKQLL